MVKTQDGHCLVIVSGIVLVHYASADRWLRLTPWFISSSKDGPASKMWPGCFVARHARCAGTSNDLGMAAWRPWAAAADTPKGACACRPHALA
jgi:hypothetical protein